MKAFLRVFLLAVVVLVAGGATFLLQPLWVNDEMIRYHLWRQHVESHYVRVNGQDIHYFESKPPGTKPGKPLVLLHGIGAHGEDWSAMIPGLAAAGFHVYAPDLLGYGRSSQPDVDYSIALQKKMVTEFMNRLRIEHADVGGWSMGGWIALKLTLDDPDLVDRLVVFDAPGIYFPPTFEASLFAPTDAPGVAHLIAIMTPKPKPLPGFVSRAAVRRIQSYSWVLKRSMAAMESGKDLLDFRLRAIRKPTLIVWGQLDALIPIAVGEEMHRDIAGSSMLIVAGCGHLVPSECSKPVLRGMIDFLQAEPPLRGAQRIVSGTTP